VELKSAAITVEVNEDLQHFMQEHHKHLRIATKGTNLSTIGMDYKVAATAHND
jgi:hypothetical protein